MTTATFLSYAELSKRQKGHPFLLAEVPVEHEISLLLPTMRWRQPGYTAFAAPALRIPRQPKRQGAPDRWWVIDPQNGQVLIYARWRAIPFAAGVHWDDVLLPRSGQTLDQVRTGVDTIETLLEALATPFFAQESGDKRTRQALSEALQAHIPAELRPQYEMLTPDFFAWLAQ